MHWQWSGWWGECVFADVIFEKILCCFAFVSRLTDEELNYHHRKKYTAAKATANNTTV